MASHESAVVSHYDRLAPRYDSLYRGDSRRSFFYQSRQAAVLRLVGSVSGVEVLEIGCASGGLAQLLIDAGARYHGVDISPGMIDECRKRFGSAPSATFHVGDSRSLAYAENSFDTVIALGMLEYVDEEQRAIDEMSRVLRNGGALILSGISKWSLYNLYERWIRRKITRWQPACILHEYHTEAEYRRFMLGGSLEVLEVVYFDFWPFRSIGMGGIEAEALGRARRGLANGFLLKARKGC